MARTTRDDLVVVHSSFFVGNSLVRSGEVWAAGDPIVRQHPQAFRPLEVHASGVAPSRISAIVRRVTKAAPKAKAPAKAAPKAPEPAAEGGEGLPNPDPAPVTATS